MSAPAVDPQTSRWSWVRPVLYLDVDGVLNPFRSKGPHKHWSDYAKHTVDLPDGSSFKLWCSPVLGRQLSDVALRHGIEIVWATSWADHVEELIVPLVGLERGLRVLAYPAVAETDLANTGKLAEVAADAGGRPAIWVDDDLGPADRAWAAEREDPTLLIRPDPAAGLRSGDLVAIEAWARSIGR